MGHNLTLTSVVRNNEVSLLELLIDPYVTLAFVAAVCVTAGNCYWSRESCNTYRGGLNRYQLFPVCFTLLACAKTCRLFFRFS